MIDVEIKAKTEKHNLIKKILVDKGARFAGVDNQIDIYFKCENGRLKLRKGKYEQALVFYQREDIKGIKPSEYTLYKSENYQTLELILRKSLGVLVEVHKTRERYFINNIKFNIDTVKGLGTFVEIEAMTEKKEEINHLKKIVENYRILFEIAEEEIQSLSYSDLLLKERFENG